LNAPGGDARYRQRFERGGSQTVSQQRPLLTRRISFSALDRSAGESVPSLKPGFAIPNALTSFVMRLLPHAGHVVDASSEAERIASNTSWHFLHSNS